MANSLQDQLRKSGLVSKQKARQASAEKRKKSKQTRAGIEDPGEVARRADLERASAQKVERDRALNRDRQAEAEVRAVAAQITQLIDMNPVDRGDQSVGFNYTVDGKIRTVHLGESMRDALVTGKLAIVADRGHAALVPAGIARKIAARDPQRVLVLNDSAPDTDNPTDDPYAQFEVPDDLMW